MGDTKEIAWSLEVLGEVGPYVRAVVPRLLAEAHDAAATHHIGLGLPSEDAYGPIWLKLPELLASELDDVEGIRLVKLYRARYRVPVINGIPLIAWRYGKRSTTNVDKVAFGSPVSDTRRAVFTPGADRGQLTLGFEEQGLGQQIVAELPTAEQDRIKQYCAEIREIAGAGNRVAVLAYASNPSALLQAYFGYAELADDDRLDWKFRRELPLSGAPTSTSRTIPSQRPAALDEDAFNSGPVARHTLRARPNPKSDTP
ncbi:hypothetical protein [Pseudonocardia sp. ICBG162]|uniref:hypothetical protein n=1 Tax=Pseudonocardia sp. ICBG162 TaxID=2846761 RepID=UPI001CF67DC4|nr:hypothetical protein [Pseudonocardia sp. ICBG162]